MTGHAKPRDGETAGSADGTRNAETARNTAAARNTDPTANPLTAAAWSAEERAAAERVVEVLGPVIAALAAAMQPQTEVVLHDLTRIPQSIAAIAGTLTGRSVGGPPTDLGLQHFSSGHSEHLIGYRTETDDGTQMRSSSVFFQGPDGRAVACLCMNTELTNVLIAEQLLQQLAAVSALTPGASTVSPAPHSQETQLPTNLLTGTQIDAPAPARNHESTRTESFPTTVDDLADRLLTDAINEAGVPVELMRKHQKVEVVHRLRDRGFFSIRDSVDLASRALQVSRPSVYNYLNEGV